MRSPTNIACAAIRHRWNERGGLALLRILVLAGAIGMLNTVADGQEAAVSERGEAPPASLSKPEPVEVYRQQVRPLLATYCFGCHGEDAQEADLRLDTLDPDMVHGRDADHWDAALDMTNSAYMPPDGEPQPSDAERRLIVDWMTSGVELARSTQTSATGGGMHRLTRDQYTHTLQELLRLPIDFGKNLPAEAKSRMGFSNSSDSLMTSPLHVEYFQAIAREALGKAIATTDRPPQTMRYRVTLGRNVGRGGRAAMIGGFQSSPIPRQHLLVEVLDEAGRPKVGRTPDEMAALENIESNIGIGMRGSSGDRYQVVDDGLVLFSALPHKEQAPKSWQGPSPNMKMLLRRCFPSEGPFAVRVVASLADGMAGHPAEGLIAPRSPDTVAKVDGQTGDVVRPTESLLLEARQCPRQDQMIFQGESLVPEDITQSSSAEFDFSLADAGYYQIDLVHPPASPDAMPSVSLQVDGTAQHLRIDAKDAGPGGLVVTPLAHAQLEAGQHTLWLGGKFFVGFREVVVSPLSDDHPISVALRGEFAGDGNYRSSRGAAIRSFVGNRTDDGMEYAEVGQPVAVDAPPGAPATYEFRDYLENLPIPTIDETETEELANIMIVGVWNDLLAKDASDRGVPIIVRSIEFKGPSYTTWPPESHKQLFFASPLQETDRDAYTREVLARFMTRAFRREVDAAEVERYFEFWVAIRDDYNNYFEGVKEVLVAVLCSPHFLYLDAAEQQPADQMVLAQRLAYFLWNSPPDQELLKLASTGNLVRELPQQVERMIADMRTERFVEAFASEWLRLDRHAWMDVNVDQYADYTRFVKRDMAMRRNSSCSACCERI